MVYHRPRAVDVDEAIENLFELEQDLIRWGPGIVESEALCVSESLTTARLTRHIDLCRSLRAQINSDIDNQELNKYNAGKLVEAVRAAWLLRAGSKLLQVTKHVVNVCAPPS